MADSTGRILICIWREKNTSLLTQSPLRMTGFKKKQDGSVRERLVCAHSAPVSSGNSDVMISEGGPLRYVRRVALSWMWLETHIIRVNYLTLSCKDALGKWQSVTWASTSWTPARAQLCWSHISDLQLHYASCLHKLTLTMTFTQPRVIWWMNFNWEYPVGWRFWLLIDLGGLSIPWASLSLGRWAWAL